MRKLETNHPPIVFKPFASSIFGRLRAKHAWILLIPLLLLTTWLGARGLNADAIWFDEWWSIYHAGGAHYGPISPVDTLMRVAQEDPRNTPGYYLLLQTWGLFAGWTPFAGRSFSLFIGLLTAAWLYCLGRDLISPQAGIGAAVLLGTGTFFTYYLHELRGYTLFTLLTTVCAWSYWRLMNVEAGWRTRAIFFLSSVGLLYTHYFASLTLAAIGLYHLLIAPKVKGWWRPALLLLLAGLTFVPWLTVLSQIIGFFQDTGASAWFALDARTAIERSLHLFSNGSISLLVLFALAGLANSHRSRGFIWFGALSALIMGLLVNEWLKIILHARYLMALWPVLALIVGLGIDYFAKRRIPLMLLLSVWALSGIWVTFESAVNKDFQDTAYYLPWNTLADALESRVQTGDGVLFLLPDQRPLRRSTHEPVAEYYLHGLPVTHELIESPLVVGEETYEQLAREYLDNSHRVWVAYDPTKFPDHVGSFDGELIKSHILCGTIVDSPQLHLNLYGHLPTSESAMAFGDGISAMPLAPFTVTDGRLNALVVWTLSDTVPSNTYSVALHLEDAGGQIAAQGDYGLPTEARSCHSSDMDVSDLPAGEYTLLLGVYNSQTGERLPATNDGETGDRLWLGSIVVGEI